MKKEVADLWIADLLNPENKQTTGVLFDGTGYCCLGRLCVVLGRKFEKDPRSDTHWGISEEGKDGMRATHVLPKSVVEEAGMHSNSGEASGNGAFLELTSVNDAGKTFPEIAEIIKQNWERL